MADLRYTELNDGEEILIEKHDIETAGPGSDDYRYTVGATFLFNDESGSDGYYSDAHQYLHQHYKKFSFFGGSIYVTNQRIIFEVNHLFSDIFADSLTNPNQIIPFDNISSTTWGKDSLSVLEINGSETVFSLKEDIQEIKEPIETIFQNLVRQKAKQCEENLDYKQAIELWESIGESDQAKHIRKRMQDEGKVKVDQTVVHGDYIDDRDTIIKDSVINRSNIGSGEDDKFTKLKELKEMLSEGLIDDDEFKQMKKEILEK